MSCTEVHRGHGEHACIASFSVLTHACTATVVCAYALSLVRIACGLQGAANVRCSQCQHLTPVAASPAAAPQPAQPARAQLQCSGCNIMLMYPRGAANVQCAVCGVVNSAQQVCGTPLQRLLLPPRCCTDAGAVALHRQSVHNSRTGALAVGGLFNRSRAAVLQANRVAHLQCQGCRTWLMYAYGARSVRCAVCEAITRTEGPAQPSVGAGPQPRPAAAPTSAAGPSGGAGGGAGPARPPAVSAAPELPAVVVQNPPTLDDDGNEVRWLRYMQEAACRCVAARRALRWSWGCGCKCSARPIVAAADWEVAHAGERRHAGLQGQRKERGVRRKPLPLMSGVR